MPESAPKRRQAPNSRPFGRGLRALGFRKDADGHAGDFRMVRAAVVAGLYPQLVKVERPPAKYAAPRC